MLFRMSLINENYGEECLNYGKLDRGVVEYKNMKSIIDRPDFIGGLICLCIPFLPVILSFPVQPHFPIKATLLAL